MACCCPVDENGCAGEDVGHYGGSYKVTFDLYKKYGEMRLLDTPICGELKRLKSTRLDLAALQQLLQKFLP